jgi:antibiotic biosynthesis monooxygenase (ABM) superfamily enzyme
MKPMMVVESLWKTPRKPMTPEQEREYNHWCNEIHIPDLLRDTGMVSVTRYKNQDGSGYLWIQEFESEEALKKYLVSDRRKELIHETESHYPGGAAAGNYFEKRSVRNFSWVAGQTRK